ncbi:amidohydrolase [Mycolicibacterium pulveris]|uniref:Amidohydrolase n=1 Tax=Mycolicibacterium pulveris TaxID=36813 RepID=A0A7I7URM1_MYCPV|nr:amidohydrolase family protein [Mycolicibacterium pulveris]MCV6983561.1 amidohydrolase [Mycolicibacterium pulveris]BBY83441.1 amidohydrolase [Mycolicibacterium pulveris]
MSDDTVRLYDADSHVAEPVDLWSGDYMPREFRGASPFSFVDTVLPDGRPATLLYERGAILLENAAYTNAAGVSGDRLAAGVRYVDANSGGWDPKQRLADMELAGITHQVINPSSPGLRLGLVSDPNLAAAMCRAYNDWVTDHCDGCEGRVSANMVLPWQDLSLAKAELQRVGERFCFVGVIMQPAPAYPSGFPGDRAFDDVYIEIAERGLALVFHSCATEEGALGPVVKHYKQFRPYWHATFYYLILGFPVEGWTAWAQLVFEGVLDRIPTLKIMLTESHGGWMVTALERMDEYAKGGEALRYGFDMEPLKLLPSEYFARQGFVVFEGDEKTLMYAAEHLGSSMVWALDYPHADCSFPGGGEDFRKNISALAPQQQRAIAWDNAARAFNRDNIPT